MKFIHDMVEFAAAQASEERYRIRYVQQGHIEFRVLAMRHFVSDLKLSRIARQKRRTAR